MRTPKLPPDPRPSAGFRWQLQIQEWKKLSASHLQATDDEGLRCTGRRGGCGGAAATASTAYPCVHWRLRHGVDANRTAFSTQIRKGTSGSGGEEGGGARERTGGIDDENEVAAPAAGGGNAIGGEADGAGLGVRVRGGTREDQRRPRRRRRSHGVSCRLLSRFQASGEAEKTVK